MLILSLFAFEICSGRKLTLLVKDWCKKKNILFTGYLLTIFVIFFFQTMEFLPSVLSLQANKGRVSRGGKNKKRYLLCPICHWNSFRTCHPKGYWSISMIQQHQAKTSKMRTLILSNYIFSDFIISSCNANRRTSSALSMPPFSNQKAKTRKR